MTSQKSEPQDRTERELRSPKASEADRLKVTQCEKPLSETVRLLVTRSPRSSVVERETFVTRSPKPSVVVVRETLTVKADAASASASETAIAAPSIERVFIMDVRDMVFSFGSSVPGTRLVV
jgi:hypothetical protein